MKPNRNDLAHQILESCSSPGKSLDEATKEVLKHIPSTSTDESLDAFEFKHGKTKGILKKYKDRGCTKLEATIDEILEVHRETPKNEEFTLDLSDTTDELINLGLSWVREKRMNARTSDEEQYFAKLEKDCLEKINNSSKTFGPLSFTIK